MTTTQITCEPDTRRTFITSARPADDPEGSSQTRDRLVLEHVVLVKRLAQRLAQRLPAQVEVADLIGAGLIGLIDAAARYRPSTGVPFDAFARRRVHGAMLDALRELDWAPRSLRKLRRDLDAAVDRLRHELQREPEDAEVANNMNLTPAEYRRALDRVRSLELGAFRQLDAKGDDGTPLGDVCLVDPRLTPDVHLERAEMSALVTRALGDLPDRERQVVILYFHEELTMAEIGRVIGVSESRVSQLRSLALSRLRVKLRASTQRLRPARHTRQPARVPSMTPQVTAGTRSRAA
jgi:RNA polymerase sigma factor FliA